MLRDLKMKMLALGLACSASACLFPSMGQAAGTIGNGDAQCDLDQVIIHGVRELILEREGDGYVDVSNPRVTWTCHNSNGLNQDGVIQCPATTNLFHGHRQKADNSQWLYDCQVK